MDSLHSAATPLECAPAVSISDLKLNAEQARVTSHLNGPLAVVSVAGSGKTFVVCKRIAELVDSGVDAARILAVTFSVKAAKEMNTRLIRLGVYGARVGTFHSLSWQIVREECPELASWTVDDRDRYRTVVKDALGYRNLDWKNHDLTVVLGYITRCKAAAALPDSDDALAIAKKLHAAFRSPQRDPTLLARAYSTAEEIRKQRELLTYDDMLLEAWTVLAFDESARVRWAEHWDHVIQDESQDENLVQRGIATMLARDHRNYMVVGDPAQAIYGFRGSDPSGMLNFPDVWQAPVIGMSYNYRSCQRIIAVANKVIDAMPANTHLGVKLTGARADDGEVTVTRYASFDEEGEGIVSRLRAQHEDGHPWKDCAVLYRTNAQSRGVEEALLSARIPYVVVGGTNFYDRKEVKDLLAYLRIGAGRGTFDDVKRSGNSPWRYLGKRYVDELMAFAETCASDMGWTDIVRAFVAQARWLKQNQKTSALQWCALIDEMTSSMALGERESDDPMASTPPASRPARILESLVMDIKYAQWLQRDEGTESPENNKVSNVRELIRAAERFPSVGELLDYIDDTLRRAAEMQRAGDAVDCVMLTSMHRSKGLEWPIVYVIGCNNKIIPHARAGDDSEERRLFYVACTRARDALHLSCVCRAAVGTRVLELEASKFLAEAGLAVVDHDSCRDLAKQVISEGRYIQQ